MEKYIENKVLETFRTRLREERKRQGLLQEELSKRCGMYSGAVYNYERGDREPMVVSLAALALELGVSTDWLLGLSDERE